MPQHLMKVTIISCRVFIWTWSLCHITCNLFAVYAYFTFKFHTIWIIYSYLKQKKTSHICIFFFGTDNGIYLCAKFLLRRKWSYIFKFTFFYTYFNDFLQPLIFSFLFVCSLLFDGNMNIIQFELCRHLNFKVHHHARCVKKVLMDEIYTYKKNDPTTVYAKYFAWMKAKREIHSLEVGHNVKATIGFL